jgi:heme exporter protein D
MESLAAFVAMGGYGAFVWPAFGLTAVVMAGLAILSLRRLRAEERDLAAIESTRPRRERPKQGRPRREDPNEDNRSS